MSGNRKNKARHAIARGLAILLAIVALGASEARADSVFLLQFGSFNSQDQANKKWDDVKSKNSDVVGKLTLHVAEATLPADNTVSYRTQAGPIATHVQAVNLCNTLQSRGVECFVVETAMLTADMPPLPADSAPELPTLPPLALPTAPALPVVEAPTPPLPEATLVPPVSVTPATTPAPAASITPTETNKPGFFGRLFGKSAAPTAPVSPAPAPAPTVVAAVPVPSVQSAPIASLPPAPVVATPSPEPVPFPVPTNLTPAVAASAEPPLEALPEPQVTPAPAAEPAPAPVKKHAKAKAEKEVADVTPDHIVPGREPRSLTSEVPGAPVAHTGNVVGDVKVAEAIRVPLGSGKIPKKAIIQKLPPVHGLGGSPSASTHKTYWAQLSYFADEDAARGFYDQFQSDYPQFSDGVRVRITRPYSSATSAGRVSLRVGPFAGTIDVRTICRAANKQGVHCTIVRDVGTSVSTNTAPARTYHSSSPGEPEQAASISSASGYWLQLGSFHSADDAWDSWKALQDDHTKLLRHVHGDVTAPTMSSASAQQYRLRAGPLSSEQSANSLCDSLQGVGADCIVVNDR